jgi:hypothetical protein
MPCVIPRPSHPPPDCRQPRPGTDRGIHFQPGSQPLRLLVAVGRWCNGSTGVFEALSHGSNPCRPTNSERFRAPQSLQRVWIGGLLPLLSWVLPELPKWTSQGYTVCSTRIPACRLREIPRNPIPRSPRPGSVDRSTLTVERGPQILRGHWPADRVSGPWESAPCQTHARKNPPGTAGLWATQPNRMAEDRGRSGRENSLSDRLRLT